MTVPVVATYSATALVDANTSFLDLIDGAATAGAIKVRDSSDTLLGTITLDDPSGTVNGTTGQLTFTSPGGDLATAAGVPAYGEMCDGDGVVHLSMPVDEGTTPTSGYLMLNTLTVVDGQVLELASAVVG